VKRAMALIAAGALVACGGKGAGHARAGRDSAAIAAKPAAPAEACGLITLPEVQEVTRLKLVPGPVSEDLQGYSSCEWSLTPGKTDGVVLVVNREGRFADYSTVPGSLPVKGFGDSASWNPGIHQLAVKRDTGTVSVSLMPDSAQRRWAERIMRTVLGRLDTTVGAPSKASPR